MSSSTALSALPELDGPGELDDLMELLDSLATRLLVGGAAANDGRDQPDALRASDLRQFAELAHSHGKPAVGALAQTLAQSFQVEEGRPGAEIGVELSRGLEKLRALLEAPSASLVAQPAPAAPLAPVAQTASLAEDQDLILEFIIESGEHLINIEAQMLILERNSGDSESAETLNAVFRAFHTIKGLAGFLEFDSIRALAHEVETLLDRARTGHLAITPRVVDTILESADVMRGELSIINMRLSGKTPPPTGVDNALLDRIRGAAQGDSLAKTLTPSPTLERAPAEPAETQIDPPRKAALEAVRPPAEAQKTNDSTSVRMDTAKLDQLLDLVGEMVIAQTLISHSAALKALTDSRLQSDLTQLARITASVQRITTGLRMVPVGLQFQKTARVVRDLSRRAGKQVLFETTGENTEVDKTVAEEISDPLLHMVRNSIDHGIEMPAERIALGKDPTARVQLAAYHQSGQIVIAISDDGRGLNRDKIFAKAVERGLVQPGEQLTDSEVFLLIFEAGFSTAEKITDISGRGVGMDVVRRHVQALRGRIDIQSTAGQGTTFFLRVPLTLAMIEGLVVAVGDQRYVAPVASVREMFRPLPGMLSTVQGSNEMVLVRDNLLPIVRLHRRFQKQPRTSALTEGTLIVAEADGHLFCLFVDDLIGKQEVVIKSLGPSFSHVIGLSGCAVLGDGKVGLILDMHGLFKGKV
jgi:two-component system chemotaxis sensor kinase CheA